MQSANCRLVICRKWAEHVTCRLYLLIPRFCHYMRRPPFQSWSLWWSAGTCSLDSQWQWNGVWCTHIAASHHFLWKWGEEQHGLEPEHKGVHVGIYLVAWMKECALVISVWFQKHTPSFTLVKHWIMNRSIINTSYTIKWLLWRLMIIDDYLFSCMTHPVPLLRQHAWELLVDGLQHLFLSWVDLIQLKVVPSPD